MLGMLALAALPAHADDSALQKLAWLAGCWAAEQDEAGNGETWMPPAAGTMLGVARTVRGGRTVAHEFMQIRETAPGQLAFIALPSGQSEATFPATKLSAGEVLFENPQHDFPQRIRHRLGPDGRLLARIEGRLDGVERAMDFVLRRIRCEQAPPGG
jgi:hypothetical protein